MSGNNLSVDGELRYIVQWFNEWSELQRDDFLPIVVEYLTKDHGTHYMNGVVNSLSAASFDDKPMSLFQCRVSNSRNTQTQTFRHDLSLSQRHFFSLQNLMNLLMFRFAGEIVQRMECQMARGQQN